MTTTAQTERQFKCMFNFSFQPRHIKSVNGVPVNIWNGSLTVNELEVTNKHVYIHTYVVSEQSSRINFFHAPFEIQY